MNTTPDNDLMKIADAAFLSDEIPGHLRPWKSAEQWKYNAPARLIIAREIERALLDRKQQTTAVLAAFGRSDIDAAIARMDAVPWEELRQECFVNKFRSNDFNTIRARLIAAARGGESQPAAVDWKAKYEEEGSDTGVNGYELQKQINAAIGQLNMDGTTPENLAMQINKKIMQRDEIHMKTIARAEKAEADLANAKEIIMAMQHVKEALPRLRPLAEAGPVPEGCVRVTAFYEGESWFVGTGKSKQDTDFADIRLPAKADDSAILGTPVNKIIASIKTKPAQSWKLPEPPQGRRWHRTDWTEEMLPEGLRPLLEGEIVAAGDEVSYMWDNTWNKVNGLVGAHADENNSCSGFRTRRALNAGDSEKTEDAAVRVAAQANSATLPVTPNADGCGQCADTGSEFEDFERGLPTAKHQ